MKRKSRKMNPKKLLRLTDIDQPHKFVEQTLKNFYRDKHPSKQWLNTCLLADRFGDAHEAFEKLEITIKNIIKSQLQKARQVTSTEAQHDIVENYYGYRDRYTNSETFYSVLQQEIGNNYKSEYQSVKIWSTLYHKYFVMHDLNDERFAQATSLSSRQIRNYKMQGVALLTEQLIFLEKNIYQNIEQQTFTSQTFIELEADHLIGLALSARGIRGEDDALQRCDVAMKYASENKLPRHFVKAGSLKIFTLFQGGIENLQLAAQLLRQIEQDPLIETLNDTPLKTWIMAKIDSMWAHIWRRRGNLEKARAFADESIKWVDKLQGLDMELEKNVYTVSSVMYWASGHYDYAEQVLKHVLNLNYEYVYDTHEMLGLINWSRCRYDIAETHFSLAIEQATSRHDLWYLACGQGNLGLVYLSRYDLLKSKYYFEQHRIIADQLGSRKELNRATANLGIVNLHLQEFNLAIKLLEQARSLYDEMSALESKVVVYANLSQAYTILGDSQKAFHLAQEAFSIAKSILGSYPPQIIALRCLGECELVNKDQRIDYLESALKLCDGYRLFDRVACLLGLAHLTSNVQDRLILKERGTKIINKIDASLWLNSHNNDYPHLLLIT